MFQWLNKPIDKLSEFLAPRKKLLPLIGMFLIVANFVLQFLPAGWVRESTLLLHFGLVIAILGLMLAWAL
ncbi:MAG TPA: hypothetical protein VII97_10820 [Anaerolineales bacterium]